MIYMVKNHHLGSRIIIFLVSTRASPQNSCFVVLIILLPVYSYLKFQKSSQASQQQQPTTSPKEICRFCIITVESSCCVPALPFVTGYALGDIGQFQPELLEWHPSDWKLRVWTDRVPAQTLGTMWVFPKIGVPPFHTPK